MAKLADLIDKDVREELEEKFLIVKPGFQAERCHVKFHVKEEHILVTLPSGKKVKARINDRSNMYFIEFLEDIPEGYKRRAIDAWDKVLVAEGVRPKRKIWKDRYRKKKKRRKSREAKTQDRRRKSHG